MVNTYSPFGFRAFGQQDGSAPTAGLTRVFIGSSDTNTYFFGDVVCQSSAGAGNGTGGVNIISNWSGSSGYIPFGVFQGCEYYNSNVGRVVWSNYFPGNVGSSALVTAWVISDPNQMFIAQASTTTAVVGASMIGYGVTLATSGSGNTTTGVSAQAIASSVTPTIQSATSPFRVVDIYQNYAPPGGVVNGTSSGSEGGAYLVVTPNNWQRRNLNSAST